MRLSTVALAVLLVAGTATCHGQIGLEVDSHPRWFEVTGGESSASVIMVYSASTGQVVGTMPARDRFLSFGENDQWVTFAFRGQTAYVPREMVSELYPVASSSSREFKGWGLTLEQQREKKQQELAALRRSKVPLSKTFTNTGTGGAGMPGGMGMMPGGGSFANYATYGPQGAQPAGGAANMGVGGGKYM